MLNRVAKAYARDPDQRAKFLMSLSNWSFVPSGRILSGAGAENSVTHYACFVLAIKPNGEDTDTGRDSRKSIMDCINNMVEITARGGGVGINWSTLRPEGAYIRGVHGRSSGAVNWMRGADGLADQIRQGGSRTAALMFVLDDWHPDLLSFIQADKFERANFSIAVSDDFMEAVRQDRAWELVFPDIEYDKYDSEWDGDIRTWREKGYPMKLYDALPARVIWQKMCRAAWASGNPGLVFLERANRRSNTHYLEKHICVNPCGEQPLPEWGVCNLGSTNLAACWDEETEDLDWDLLERSVWSGVEFLDRVIDCTPDINDEIRGKQTEVRRIGLGSMGLADVLIRKKLRYGSDESLSYIQEIYTRIRDAAYRASISLAQRLGPAPGFKAEEYLQGDFIKTLPEDIREDIREHGIRNLSILTQAPTGTTSILAGASSGIEPIFSAKYVREDATGRHVMEHPLFIEDSGDHLVTAPELSYQDHVRVQGVIQEMVDASISKTINMPAMCTIEDVSEAYLLAYDLGCKGITVYRDGSQGNVLTSLDEEKEQEPGPEVNDGIPMECDLLDCKTCST